MSKRLKYAPDSCAEAVELVISSQKSQIDITAPLVFNGGRLGNGAALAALSILTPKQGNEAPRNEPTKRSYARNCWWRNGKTNLSETTPPASLPTATHMGSFHLYKRAQLAVPMGPNVP